MTTKGEGVNNIQKFDHVVYGWSLSLILNIKHKIIPYFFNYNYFLHIYIFSVADLKFGQFFTKYPWFLRLKLILLGCQKISPHICIGYVILWNGGHESSTIYFVSLRLSWQLVIKQTRVYNRMELVFQKIQKMGHLRKSQKFLAILLSPCAYL